MADLKTLCIDSECMDVGAGAIYTAGTNIEIATGDVINSLIQSGTNITVGADGKVNLNASPALTGTPTAPTNGTASTSNTQIATTAFVQNAIKRRLPVTVTTGSIASVSVATGGAEKYSANFWTAPSNGIAFIKAEIVFAANATGIRLAGIYSSTTAQNSTFVVQAASAGTTQVTPFFVTDVTSGKTFRMRYTQTGSAAISVSGHYSIYFIPD